MIVITIAYFNFHTMYDSLRLEKQQLQLEKQQLELERQQLKLDAYPKNSAVTNELIDFVRMRQHGISNILTSLAALSKIHTDYDSLSSALTKAIDVYIADNAPIALLEIKPSQIAGFLYSKYSIAAQQGIELVITLGTPTFPEHIPEYKYVDVLGILIDNALEASAVGQVCYLYISRQEEQMQIVTKNPGPVMTPQLRRQFFQKGYTSKPDPNHLHGLGLNTLKQYLTLYHGNIRIVNEEINGLTYLCFEINL